MLEVFAHANLSHQLVLVSVHTRQLTNVSENVLQTIRQLKGVNVVQTILNMCIHHQFRQPQDFTAQMESVTETRLLTLLGGQCLDRLQVEVVVEMKVVQVLTMNQKVQHVVALSTDLESSFHPIQLRRLQNQPY